MVNNANNKSLMKAKTVIGFRPDGETAKEFAQRVELLGVTDSELASLAFKLGLDAATVRLAREKAEKAQSAWHNLQKTPFFVGSSAPVRELVAA